MAAPEHRVSRLVPFVHVEDVERSIAFYHRLGFTVASVYRYRGGQRTRTYQDLLIEPIRVS